MTACGGLIGSHDVLLVTLDTLRYDVAAELAAAGRTPQLARVLPGGRWERRHSPASFTYAAHHAFFAGFLPTPAAPGRHDRLFAAPFPGSETAGADTWVFDAPDLPTALAAAGYHTVCLGGVGFFNRRSPLGSVLPGLFAEAHWEPAFGVTAPGGLDAQLDRLAEVLAAVPGRAAAVHVPQRGRRCTSRTGTTCPAPPTTAGPATPPPWPTSTGGCRDCSRWSAARGRPVFVIICSDHGTRVRRGRPHRAPVRPRGRLDGAVRRTSCCSPEES